jgi:hypothetical protein
MTWARGRGHHEAAEVDHGGAFTHHRQHQVGQSLGEAGLGEDHADHDGSEDEPHRRVKELLEGEFSASEHRPTLDHTVRANEEQRLKDADENRGHTDGNDLEDPPDRGHEEERDGGLSLGGEFERLSVGIHRRGPRRREVHAEEENRAEGDEKGPLPVDGLVIGRRDAKPVEDSPNGIPLHVDRVGAHHGAPDSWG